MNTGVTYKINDSCNSIADKEQDRIKIRVTCALFLDRKEEKEPIISITGDAIKQDACACIYVGKVILSGSGFISGSRVAVFGISDVGPTAQIIEADPRVVRIVPQNVSDQMVAFSGFAAPWINMLKTANPPLGSIIRVGGSYAKALIDILRHVGYAIATENDKADYFFPTDNEAIGEAVHMIPWVPNCGADWNDARLFDNRFTYPAAYVNNCTLDNLQTFWMIAPKLSFTADIWPHERIITNDAADERNQYHAGHLPRDAAYLDFLGEYRADLENRKKPATVFLLCGASFGSAEGAERVKKVMAWIGSVPVKVTVGTERSHMTICFADGSVGTIQFAKGIPVEHAELHFDGKSIFIEGDRVNSFDCTGIGTCSPEKGFEVAFVEAKRKEVIVAYEQR